MRDVVFAQSTEPRALEHAGVLDYDSLEFGDVEELGRYWDVAQRISHVNSLQDPKRRSDW